MNTDLRKAAEMALEALENYKQGNSEPAKALRQALAQPEQEPVAWITECQEIGPDYGKKRFDALPIQSLNPLRYKHTPLYTAPPKREWVGLTDEEIEEYKWMGQDVIAVIKEIQATLKEKNL